MRNRFRAARFCWIAFSTVFVIAARSPATVLDVRGRVSTTVQELLAGEPGSVTSDESEVGVDATELPISAGASLQTKDFADRVIALGQGICELTTPDVQSPDGPRELGLEVAGFSDGESVSYLVTGSAIEERRVLFAGPGNAAANSEFPFNADGTREIESQISLSGAIVVWSLDPSADVREVQSELTVDVRRDEEADPLFRTSVSLSASSSASIPEQPALDTTGPIRSQQLSVDELVALGLDDTSAEILRSVADTGSLAVFIIPRQEHTYRYTVRRDVESTLIAELKASVRTAPGSTGVAVTLGRPFHDLADFIGRAIPGVDGAQMEKAINKAIAPDDEVQPAQEGSDPPRTRSLCGVFGAELLLAPLMMLLLSSPRRRRDVHPTRRAPTDRTRNEPGRLGEI